MPDVWQTSKAFDGFLSELVRASDFASSIASLFPCIMWSLGGTISKRGQAVETVPPRYEVTLIERPDLSRFAAIPNERFGFIAFSPKPEDQKSSRRLIDFDGHDIVVR